MQSSSSVREGSVYHVGLLFVKGHITVSVIARAVRNNGVVWLYYRMDETDLLKEF